MQLDNNRLYGFKTLKKEEWSTLASQTLDGGLGSQLGVKVGGTKAPAPSLHEFVGHQLGSRVGGKPIG